MLEALDLSRELSKIEYHEQLPELQRRLHQLQRSCWEEKLATIVVLEGWDASGKGSVISKITRRLEPRGFSLHAIREPRTFESLLPWMWRTVTEVGRPIKPVWKLRFGTTWQFLMNCKGVRAPVGGDCAVAGPLPGMTGVMPLAVFQLTRNGGPTVSRWLPFAAYKKTLPGINRPAFPCRSW